MPLSESLEPNNTDAYPFSQKGFNIEPSRSEKSALQLPTYLNLEVPTADPKLNELAALAAEALQVPVALIRFNHSRRHWFKFKAGLALTETSRAISFCNYASQELGIFTIKDTLADQRFAANPLVAGNPAIRFYAGAPLVTREGQTIGTLCVVDHKPRDLTLDQIRSLQILSRQIIEHLELQRSSSQLKQLTQQVAEQELFCQQESILLHLANQIHNSLDLNSILQTTVAQIYELLHVDRCQFLWCLPAGMQFNLTATHEAKRSGLPDCLGDFSQKYASLLIPAIQSQTILRIENIHSSPSLDEAQDLLLQLGIHSQLLLPLKTHSDQLGAIVCTQHHSSRIWTDSEVKLLRAVTDQVAIALDQAELFAQTRAAAFAAETQTQYLTDALHKLQQTQTQLVQHEKMSSLGQLVAGIAHEINNPVNFIDGNVLHANRYIADLLDLLQLYQQHYPEPTPEIQTKIEDIDLEFLAVDLPKLLSSMKIGSERIRQIVLSLRNFSRLDEAERKPVDIHEGIDNTLLILSSRLKANPPRSAIRIVKEYCHLPLVECYAGQLNQVFMNILANAIDALEEQSSDPTITIATELLSCPDPTDTIQPEPAVCRPQAVIRIQDNGSGMPEAVRQKLFNPFFTTKPVGKGTGLGLSISYQIIVEKHGGVLKCFSEPGVGTTFWIQIPIYGDTQ